MELNTDNRHPTRSMSFDQAAAFSDPEGMMQRATPDVGVNSLSYETELLEPAAMAANEPALSFNERILAVQTVIRATEDMASTVVESDSDDTKHRPQQPSTSFTKQLSDTRSEMERI